MKLLVVRHRDGEYPVHVSAETPIYAAVREIVGSRPVLVVTDEHVAPLWLKDLSAVLPRAATLQLPAGESTKTLATVERIWSELARLNYGRDTVLVALGGGVIGDMTGFAAACWMRGIDFIQLPTTLLAQVDASVGGKTGVDLSAGKNLVGAFHQPRAVFIDVSTLDTLPEREFAAGIAEVVKTALIVDAGFFGWLEDNVGKLRTRDADTLMFAIRRCCEIKAGIVMDDEREHGARALLNLGHTFAHAIESVTGYRRFVHGEAVAIGLVLAARLSENTCALDAGLRPRIAALLESFALPVTLPGDIDRDALLRAMQLDKKHTRAGWRLILLEGPGRAIVRVFADAAAVRRVLETG